MRLFVRAVAVLMALVGLWFLIQPGSAQGMVQWWSQGERLWLAVGFRLVVGGLLIYAASACVWSLFVRVLGIVTVIAAVALPLVGFDTIRTLLEWVMALDVGAIRAWGGFGVGLGYLLYRGS